jgi:hypothetical protein
VSFPVYSTSGVNEYVEFLTQHGFGDLSRPISRKLETTATEFIISKFHDDCRTLMPAVEVILYICRIWQCFVHLSQTILGK